MYLWHDLLGTLPNSRLDPLRQVGRSGGSRYHGFKSVEVKPHVMLNCGGPLFREVVCKITTALVQSLWCLFLLISAHMTRTAWILQKVFSSWWETDLENTFCFTFFLRMVERCSLKQWSPLGSHCGTMWLARKKKTNNIFPRLYLK